MLLAMTAMGSVAALFFKRASSFISIKQLLTNVNLYIGGGIYVACAALNIIVLRYLEYSVVLPVTSLTYVWTLIIAVTFLKEKATKRKVAGLAFIICGAVLIAFS
jgi:drug/metabolite transporter (DMT)-like permease